MFFFKILGIATDVTGKNTYFFTWDDLPPWGEVSRDVPGCPGVFRILCPGVNVPGRNRG